MAGLLERCNQARRAAGRAGAPPFEPGQAKRYVKQLLLGLVLLQNYKVRCLLGGGFGWVELWVVGWVGWWVVNGGLGFGVGRGQQLSVSTLSTLDSNALLSPSKPSL